MVVKRCDYFVVGGRVEHFLHLLQERLPVELGGRDEGVLPQQDVFTLQGRIEVLVQQVQGFFILAIEDDLDSVLKVDLHLVELKVVGGLLGVTVF